MEKPIYLILENGAIFCGKNFGAALEAPLAGELVFTTAMTGYLETLTDPSYYGQIVTQTFPLIGNYGVIPADFESDKPHLTAYVVREYCSVPSNFRCQTTLDSFLKAQNIVGLYGIDTRELTKTIREQGVMNGVLSSSLLEPALAQQIANAYLIHNAVDAVTCSSITTHPSQNSRYKVVLWDFGAKKNIQRELIKRDCDVIRVPAHTSAAQILALHPDGLLLSNGPGDPAENTAVIAELAALFKLKKIPTLGICLGHQLLALAQGAKTQKLKYGHRGANQPVKQTATGRVFITSQNHGYTVVSLPAQAQTSYENANDRTCEGITYEDIPAFSVQFHPEACGGPRDTNFLFDRFIALMEEQKNAAQ